MALDKTLAFALVGTLAACGPSVEFDDVRDDEPAVPDGADDTGDVFTDQYINAPGYGAMVPGPETPPADDGGLTGTVFRYDGEETVAVPGARVILATRNLTKAVITGDTGTFAFDVEPGDHLIVVEAKGYWGVAREISIPAEGVHGLEWFMSITDAEVQAIADETKLPFDPSMGVVSAYFSSAVGGERMALTSSSAPAVTFNANDVAVISDELLPAGLPMLIFSNVEVSWFDAQAIGVSGKSHCRAEPSPLDAWPALPHVVTYVPVTCVVQ